MESDAREDLRLARAGNREAIGRLLEREQARLRKLVEARLGTALRAKVRVSDVLQSAYLVALQGGFRGATDDEFRGWVARIVENRIRDKGKYFAAAKRRRGGGDA